MWNVLNLFLMFFVNMVIIVPVMVVARSFIQTPDVDMFVLKGLALLFHEVTPNMVLLTEITGVVAASCLIWTMVLPNFPVTRSIMRSVMNFEEPTEEEQAKINKAWDVLESRAVVSRKNYQCFVWKINAWNAISCGANDIAISGILLRDFSPEQLAGIMAHEIGHHVHGDIKYQNIINGMTFVSNVCVKILVVLRFVLDVLRIIPFLGWFTAILSFSISIFFALYSYLIVFPARFFNSFFTRRNEYAADAYAVKLGLGNELISGMNEIIKVERKMHWWEVFLSDHPRTKSRIKAAKKKMLAMTAPTASQVKDAVEMLKSRYALEK